MKTKVKDELLHIFMFNYKISYSRRNISSWYFNETVNMISIYHFNQLLIF